ncbi:L,D-transpeptidase family protein [Pararhizobium haloflavum]|uniref:L,D-transpeptidase family protein n=1 Tax=Pararhizobium haloflavum TaxID=2037914 RepID=UPI000C180E4E|nr:murein L,D-transpeptidase family protein [Pararhizobium haloflavum]
MKGWHRLLMISGMCFTLAACNDTLSSVSNKVEHPLPTKVVSRMQAYGMTEQSPIMMRIFKEENLLEIWKAKSSGRYEKIAEYEICKWSGALGPKRQEGDRQAPEGFYTVSRHQMNPNSSYYLSFNLGYPNKFDRSHGRTGSNLMVHGACSSAGCYSMSDENVLEIYAFAREAFRGGQDAFQVQAFPFRMTAENMARNRDNPNYEFWKMLKVGYDHFELTKTPPKVDVCEQKYVFNRMATTNDAVFDARAQCPQTTTPQSLEVAYSSYVQAYEKAYDDAVRKLTGKSSSPFSSLMGTGPKAGTAPVAAPASSAVETPAQAPTLPQPSPTTLDMETEVIPAPAPQAGAASIPTPEASPAPVPMPSDNAAAAPAPAPAMQQTAEADKPFWNLWSRN